MFFTVLAHTAIYAFYSLYLDRLGYGKGQVGALWAVSVAAERPRAGAHAVPGYGVSGVLGSLGGAWLAESHGYAACFWAGSVFALIGAWSHWRCAKRDPLHAI